MRYRARALGNSVNLYSVVTFGLSVSTVFSQSEIEYMKGQRLCRFATVSPDGQPDVVPVAFEFDGKYFYVGSHSQDIFHRTRKYKNVRDGKNKVALAIDDLLSVEPWRPRAIRVYGTAEIVEHKGMFGPGKYLRITPKVSWSMGIEGLKLKKGQWSLKTLH
jgi:pyridoxamine 5'-phosphate oxidase family protein